MKKTWFRFKALCGIVLLSLLGWLVAAFALATALEEAFRQFKKEIGFEWVCYRNTMKDLWRDIKAGEPTARSRERSNDT